MASSEIDETLKRVSAYPGVQGLIVINADGIPIRTTLDNETSVQYAALVSHFAAKARAVLRALPLPGASSDAGANELLQLRLRSAKHEIVVAPDRDYTLIIVQGGPPKPV